MKTKTTRICAGEYEVKAAASDFRSGRGVRVTKVHYPGDGEYWIAAAQWDQFLYSDPLHTKKRAVEVAVIMLEDLT